MIPVPRIEKISPLKYKKPYFSVFFDDGQSFRIHQDLVGQYALAENLELNGEKISEIQSAAEKKEATEYAYLFLSYRGRSEKEMRERLKRKGFSEPTADQVIQTLKSQSLINDVELAKNLTDSRFKNRLWGRSRVRQDLVKKGIEPKMAEEVSREIESQMPEDLADEDERAYRLLMKRKEQIKSLDVRTQHRRLFGYLARRGFSFDVIEKVLSRYKREVNFGKSGEAPGAGEEQN